MSPVKMALLSDRGVVGVAGEDAEKLLQGVIANDMALLARQAAMHAALLTPQGKILFEFFVVKAPGGFLLETGSDQAAGLVKRLGMYKLRAKVTITDASAEYRVIAVWSASPRSSGEMSGSISYADPRLPALGLRVLAETRSAAGIAAATNGVEVPEQGYHADRIALGVPEAGKDYVLGDTFPHEANMDVLNGVSFTKGCFVGQEVVSRMHHRATTRKRIVIVEAQAPLQPGSEILAGAASIGRVGSVAGNRALALLRRDRAAEAEEKGEPLTAAGIALVIRLPDYLRSAAAAGAP
ncbi:MAG: folate-binding protein YgfZ [Hyphomicrobiaceae bacterium]|nr:MAG: folate-binding protein YgfZ [Hyphomicrobiaceae bacterium]